jgi:hypothetical protein
MGTLDKTIRIIIAIIIGYLYYNGTISGTLGIILMVFAAIFILTSIISFCPLYIGVGQGYAMIIENVNL